MQRTHCFAKTLMKPTTKIELRGIVAALAAALIAFSGVARAQAPAVTAPATGSAEDRRWNDLADQQRYAASAYGYADRPYHVLNVSSSTGPAGVTTRGAFFVLAE